LLGTAARPTAIMDAYRQGDNFYICLTCPASIPDPST
jgi:hypothetical protein